MVLFMSLFFTIFLLIVKLLVAFVESISLIKAIPIRACCTLLRCTNLMVNHNITWALMGYTTVSARNTLFLLASKIWQVNTKTKTK